MFGLPPQTVTSLKGCRARHGRPEMLAVLLGHASLAAAGGAACIVSNGTLHLERYSTVGGGKLLPGFLFMQGESDGLEQALSVRTGGGRGEAIPFVPDDSCDDAIFEGTSPDLRSPQLPYLKYDTWGCERKPAALPVITLESSEMVVTVTPQFGGKVWGMRDKAAGGREFFFHNSAHQPANIGARGAWVAGGLEFNWAPGFLGHSAFTEERVWAAKLATERGDVVRIWEYDRYNGSVYQVDMILDGAELWTHVKVTNPNRDDMLGYWWTCAAHAASPGTRILAPASEVTVETFVGSKLRNANWPAFDNGMLNSSFGGVSGQRLVDSSYLGNIAYTGDYFLRVPPESRKWIAHVGEDGYVAVHGHPMNGTKFFTWGQSGPGRFMQDFLSGGAERVGDYTELQSGVTPTQQQVFELKGGTSLSFTEYFKPMRKGALPADYANATDAVGRWWDSAAGVPVSKTLEMEAFFAGLEDRPVKRGEVVSEGSAWGQLQEALTGRTLAPGAPFFPSSRKDAELWRELASTGGFSDTTLASTRAPLAYAVDGAWVGVLERSMAKKPSWLHRLLLAVAYAEAGEVDRPRTLLEAALAGGGARCPIVPRTLAVLETEPLKAWAHFTLAWNVTMLPPPAEEPVEVTQRLTQNVADELLQFLIGNVPGATTGTADTASAWFGRLELMNIAAAAAIARVGAQPSDTLALSIVIQQVSQRKYGLALASLAAGCFPTLGRGRDVLISLWAASVVGEAAAAKGRPLTTVEAHRVRRARPVPRNIGCPYATLYCEQYW